MNEHDTFIRTICEQPWEDTHRLVYADWLDEHDQPERAEFIRDQIEWRPGSRDCDLLDDNWDRWFPDVTRHDERGFYRAHNHGGGVGVPLISGNMVVFTRGFISLVRFTTTASFFDYVHRGYWQHQPVTNVSLADTVVYASGGSSTYYVGGLGRFPREYWHRLDGLPTVTAALTALSRVCVDWGRSLVRPPLPAIDWQQEVVSDTL